MRDFYIKGQVVGLAEFLEDDYRLMYETWQDPVTQRNFNVKFQRENYEDFFRFFTDPKRPPFRFVTTIVRLEDRIPVGRISVSPASMEPDLGIWIFNLFRGQGYGREAVILAVTYLFEHSDLDYIVIGIYEHNEISRRLFEKVGFQRATQYDEVEQNAFGEGEVVQMGFMLKKKQLSLMPDGQEISMSMMDAIPVRFAHVDDMGWCMHTLTVTSDAVMKCKIDFKEIIVAEMKENRVGVLELMYLWQGHKGCVPYISSIMVLNPYRRQGVGRSLLKFLESHLLDNGFDVLLSSSQLDEWPPQAWHRHMGFEECGILNGVNQCGVGEVFFRKRLTV